MFGVRFKKLNKIVSISVALAMSASLISSVSFLENDLSVKAESVQEHDVGELLSSDDISYEETTDAINNPYIGFYQF
ncbi:hypothetical protein SAMN06297422_1021 [Lachnospiraceae bacterium]|nr:hypothetical protein SAMN06297422_1021 [Lachnospiraceae bacterium]